MSGDVDSEPSCETRLRQLIIMISQDMYTLDREVIVTLLDIPAESRERIQTNIQLWTYLHDRDDFSYQEEERTLAFLRRVLNPILFGNDERLIDHVRRYCGQSVTPPSENGAAQQLVLPSYSGMEIAFKYLSENLSYDWRRFLRELLRDAVLDQLEHDTRFDSLSEKIYRGLRKWQQMRGSVTVDDLIASLRRCELNIHADEIVLRLTEQSYPITIEH